MPPDLIDQLGEVVAVRALILLIKIKGRLLLQLVLGPPAPGHRRNILRAPTTFDGRMIKRFPAFGQCVVAGRRKVWGVENRLSVKWLRHHSVRPPESLHPINPNAAKIATWNADAA